MGNQGRKRGIDMTAKHNLTEINLRYLKEQGYTTKDIVKSKVCFRCGTNIIREKPENDIPFDSEEKYPYYCVDCDENMWSFEVIGMTKKNKVKILVDKLPKRSDPIFYTNFEKIAEVNTGKYTFFAWACGDIYMVNKKTGKEYTNHNIDDISHLTDKQISDKYFDWHNNNWFEISATDNKKNQFIDLAESAGD